MKHSFFYIPFFYFYKTRLKNISSLMNWFAIYIAPTYAVFLNMMSGTPFGMSTIIYIVMVSVVYSIYEAGYIQNDTETIKLETSPTLRLTQSQLAYYKKYKFVIYMSRLTFSLLFMMILFCFWNVAPKQIFLSMFGLLMMGVTFVIYNHIRNTLILLLLFILVSLRYILPLLPFYNDDNIFYFFLIILIYPILNLMDWMYRPQFKKYALPLQKGLMRIIYYSLLSVIFIYLFIYTGKEIYKFAFSLSMYFFVYRSIFWYIKKRDKE